MLDPAPLEGSGAQELWDEHGMYNSAHHSLPSAHHDSSPALGRCGRSWLCSQAAQIPHWWAIAAAGGATPAGTIQGAGGHQE